ncbi:MAG TPA: class I SAM-dependent methyltransferase [Mycetocola sp.]|nr:class I SAM-dependent methyltransferase [Mycetocola sp.]
MVNEVSRAAYSHRATEYIELLGSVTAMHPSDLQLISTWAGDVEGEIIDAGCGPGHWTNFLAEQGLDARGVDLVPEFISHARNTFPGVDFTLGSLDSLDVGMGSIGGILSWYSLIHHEPELYGFPYGNSAAHSRPEARCLSGSSKVRWSKNSRMPSRGHIAGPWTTSAPS